MYVYEFGENFRKLDSESVLTDWSQVESGVKNGIFFLKFPNGLQLEFLEVEQNKSVAMTMFSNYPIETLYPDDAWIENE